MSLGVPGCPWVSLGVPELLRRRSISKLFRYSRGVHALVCISDMLKNIHNFSQDVACYNLDKKFRKFDFLQTSFSSLSFYISYLRMSYFRKLSSWTYLYLFSLAKYYGYTYFSVSQYQLFLFKSTLHAQK